jgi:hypothetical protein
MEPSEDPSFEATGISYVLNGKEVVMTGRTAVRSTSRRDYTLYEVKPKEVDSNDPKFCSWVTREELYEIQ